MVNYFVLYGVYDPFEYHLARALYVLTLLFSMYFRSISLIFPSLPYSPYISLLQYDSVLDMPCVVRSSNLVQELGMVSNVFSDKTGTLTRNEMKFVKFIVDGKLFDLDPPADATADEVSPIGDEKKMKNGQMSTVESDVRSILDGPRGNKSKVYDFLRCLTTCHTVIREKDGTYRAESPDELALVEGVSKFQCGLGERGTTTMNVTMLSEAQTYEILAVNAFNSDRKRMSILLKDKSSGEYYLMCKGADSTMLDLCAMDEASRRSVDKSLLDLACFGLRTLCIAHKRLTPEAAQAWLNQYRYCRLSLYVCLCFCPSDCLSVYVPHNVSVYLFVYLLFLTPSLA